MFSPKACGSAQAARFARNKARADHHVGLDVLVQDVMEAMTTLPDSMV